jgi:hypothetical protein
MPSTLMSSSTSGQWTPWPVPMSRKFARCAVVASASRQDQASGTLITRPSTSCAMISSSVTRISSMRGSLLTTVFMPCLQNESAICLNHAPNDGQLSGAKSMTASQPKRLKPELASLALTLDVYMGRLAAVETCKEEPIWTRDTRDSWHSDTSLRRDNSTFHVCILSRTALRHARRAKPLIHVRRRSAAFA